MFLYIVSCSTIRYIRIFPVLDSCVSPISASLFFCEHRNVKREMKRLIYPVQDSIFLSSFALLFLTRMRERKRIRIYRSHFNHSLSLILSLNSFFHSLYFPFSLLDCIFYLLFSSLSLSLLYTICHVPSINRTLHIYLEERERGGVLSFLLFVFSSKFQVEYFD